jgi:hypothetical protein
MHASDRVPVSCNQEWDRDYPPDNICPPRGIAPPHSSIFVAAGAERDAMREQYGGPVPGRYDRRAAGGSLEICAMGGRFILLRRSMAPVFDGAIREAAGEDRHTGRNVRRTCRPCIEAFETARDDRPECDDRAGEADVAKQPARLFRNDKPARLLWRNPRGNPVGFAR